MNNETLLLYCAAGDFAARKERLLREIMSVDDVSALSLSLSLSLCMYVCVCVCHTDIKTYKQGSVFGHISQTHEVYYNPDIQSESRSTLALM